MRDRGEPGGMGRGLRGLVHRIGCLLSRRARPEGQQASRGGMPRPSPDARARILRGIATRLGERPVSGQTPH